MGWAIRRSASHARGIGQPEQADRLVQQYIERRRAQRELIVACAAKLRGLGARPGQPMDVGTLAQSGERRLWERDPQAADYFRGLTSPEKRDLLVILRS